MLNINPINLEKKKEKQFAYKIKYLTKPSIILTSLFYLKTTSNFFFFCRFVCIYYFNFRSFNTFQIYNVFGLYFQVFNLKNKLF